MNSRKTVHLAVLLAIAGVMAPVVHAEPAKREYTETFDKTFPLSAGAQFTLDNRNGSIEIDTWDKEEIHIVAEKRMRPNNDGFSWLTRLIGLKSVDVSTDEQAKKLFAELTIDVTGDAANRSVATTYPAVKGVEFQVSYRITAPKRMVTNVKTVNGTVRVANVEGDASIETTNGSVNLSNITGTVHAESTNGRLNLKDVSGTIEAETTNGSVSVATRPDAPIAAPISLESTNGNVDVAVPAQSSFDLDLRTVNGSATCELPLANIDEQTRKRLKGAVGAGGPLITLRTTNGRVRVDTQG